MAKTRIIAVCGLKGGSAKTTTAVNIATSLAKHGSTLLIDADSEQGTAGYWWTLRQEHGRGASAPLTFATARTHKELINLVEARTDERYLVIDSPPRLAQISRSMIMLADLVLLPMTTSAPEIWSSMTVMELIAEAKKVHPVKARGVWSRFKAGKSTNEFAEEATAALKLKFCESVMTQRLSYQNAMNEGLGVIETRDRTAKAEMNILVDEIMGLVK